ncbi:MAG: DNA primase [Acidimicrobiales bacterium]|jgi:DNA primase
MAIPDEDVAEVRAATDILALIGEYTPLKRVGRRYVGLCPFHSEKTASFSVNAEEGLYYCFGCQASGDAITFLRNIEGCDFVEAVDRLASRAGIAIRHDTEGKDQSDREGRQALLGVMDKAVAFYHEQLLSSSDAKRARQYLRSRGYEGETVRQFAMGWSPESGRALVQAVRAPTELLVKAGLAHQGQNGLRDAFRGRVIFPIFDPAGKAIGLGGRILPGAGDAAGPKYRNSPETPVYSKRRTLYGLNWAKHAVVQAGEVIVCEGYTDVIGFFTAGLPRAVATCGTALTEEHFRLLGRFAKRVVLAFDADSAGQSAAARFYEWEKRHEIEVAVAALPEGSDPADLAMHDPEVLKQAVEQAKTFLSFRVDRVLASSELKTGEGRAHAAEAALAMVAEHPNELVRDQYLVTVSDRTRVDAERLRPMLDALVRAFEASGRKTSGDPGRPTAGNRPRQPDEEPPWEPDPEAGSDEGATAPRPSGPGPNSRRGFARVPPGARAGRDALVLAIREPETMAGRLNEALFADALQRAALRALLDSESLHEAIEKADDNVADLLRRLAVTEPDADPDQTVAALARAAAQVALDEIEADARQAEAEGDEARLAAAGAAIGWLKSELELMQEPGTADRTSVAVTEAAERLVAWLLQRYLEAR